MWLMWMMCRGTREVLLKSEVCGCLKHNHQHPNSWKFKSGPMTLMMHINSHKTILYLLLKVTKQNSAVRDQLKKVSNLKESISFQPWHWTGLDICLQTNIMFWPFWIKKMQGCGLIKTGPLLHLQLKLLPHPQLLKDTRKKKMSTDESDES